MSGDPFMFEDIEQDDRQQAETIYPCDTMQDVLELWDTVIEKPIVATTDVMKALEALKNVRRTKEHLAEIEQELKDRIAVHMKNHGKLITHDGEELVTWFMSSDSMRVDTSRLKKEMPAVYEMFSKRQPGTRRFLLKGEK